MFPLFPTFTSHHVASLYSMVYWSKRPNTQVVCFTGTQIPGIEDRLFPPELCHNDLNGNLYPHGIQIYPESMLEELIVRYGATLCALAYSDLSYTTVQSLASRVNATGCQFVQLPPAWTQLTSRKPVVAIVASRTGVGKSQTTRYVARYYKSLGLKVAAVRHPMPYDKNLNSQRCQRYQTMADMDKYRCTIEEREEYYRHIEDGTLLFAGVDYEMILRLAERDADVILWDGGNNDTSFFRPDLTVTLVDSLRPTDELHYFPGETNVRMADLVLITKTNELPDMKHAVDHATHLRTVVQKKGCPILFGRSKIVPEVKDASTGLNLPTVEAAAMVRGKRVLVVDDGPTLTHGGLPSGAGYALARSLDPAEIIDPRPYAQGSLKGVFAKFGHLANVLPAMGYGPDQVRDLHDTIQAVDCDVVVVGTPIDIRQVMEVDKPCVVVARYDLEFLEPGHEEAFHRSLDSAVAPAASGATN
jgi:predicted GTPase